MATKAALNTKATEIECKIPEITNLATKDALNTKVTEIESKIPDTRGFVTNPAFTRLTKIIFDTSLTEAAKNLASKSQVDNAIDIANKSREKLVWFKLF